MRRGIVLPRKSALDLGVQLPVRVVRVTLAESERQTRVTGGAGTDHGLEVVLA